MSQALSPEPLSLTVEARAHGWRIDHYLSRLFSNYSRALIQKAIEQQAVLLNGLPVKMSKRVKVNDLLSVRLPVRTDQSLPPEDLPLQIVYEDEHLVVINKAAGMIVHPGKGNYGGTLAAALQFHFDRLSDAAGRLRPGIVHRLDRDTSGVLVVAKDNQVHHRLSSQFERREVRKEYRALVHGIVERDSDFIETHMRVNPQQREKMCVCEPGGNSREAVTFFEVLERFAGYTYVRLLPKTGRTHQLRVHLRHLGHAIVSDRLYGGKFPLDLVSAVDPKFAAGRCGQASIEQQQAAVRDAGLIGRHALHAFRLEIDHPVSGDRLSFEAPLPEDIQATLLVLRTRKKEFP